MSIDRTGIEGLLEHALSQGIPGISAAIASRDGIVWEGAAGVANVQTGEPVRPDMLFGIGSITKAFVAVVILRLVEEGCLSLDSTAAQIMGAAVAGVPNADQATIAQLLNHTGGVPSWENEPAWIRDGRGASLDPTRLWGTADTLCYVMGHTPLAPPGVKFSYSNTNYTLLGMIIEKITGRDAVSAIHRYIRVPLGLHDLYLEGFEAVPQSRLPHRYHCATAEFRRLAGVNSAFPEVRPGLIDVSCSNLSVEWAAGGMVATARDLASYAVALRDGRLLGESCMRFMSDWRPVHEGLQIGHNLFRTQYPGGVAVIGHDGGVLGFTAAWYWIEGGDTAVAVLCNAGSVHAGTAAEVNTLVGKTREFVKAVLRLPSGC